METKVKKTDKEPIPAGMFGPGIEPFYYAGEKWVFAFGVVKRFSECSSAIQDPIRRAFINDKQSLAYMTTKLGLTKDTETFDRWYQCVIGGLDNVPDFLNGKFIPDAFNNLCSDTTCTLRGILCGRAVGLKNYEVETLAALKQGESMERTASKICVSLPGMKSRVEHIKQKLNVTNMAALMALTAELGI